MIAVDTSTLVAYLAGEAGRDIEVLNRALAHNQDHLPPVVVTEMLSAPNATESSGISSWRCRLSPSPRATGSGPGGCGVGF